MALLGLLHNKPSHFLNFRRTAMMSKQKTSHVYGSRSWLFVCLGLVALIAILSWYMGHHSYQSSDFYLRAQYIGNSMSYCPACYELVKTYLKPYKGPVPPAIQSKADTFLHSMKDCVQMKLRNGKFQNKGFNKARYYDFDQNVKMAIRLFGPIPDVDFWFCINDESHLPKSLCSSADGGSRESPPPPLPRPVLAFCMHQDYYDISIPFKRQDPSTEPQHLQMLETWRSLISWKDKTRKAVWRGSPTGNVEGQECSTDTWRRLPRSQLIQLSLEHPEVIDAAYSNINRQCPQRVTATMIEEGFGFKSGLKLKDYFSYTSLIDVDGNTWSSRFSDLVSTGNAVFKQESPFWDWIFPLAEPGKDFIPIKKDLSDAVERIQSMSLEELKEVGDNGFAFYKRFLTPTKQLCYLHLLLSEYAKLASSPSDEENDVDVNVTTDGEKGKERHSTK